MRGAKCKALRRICWTDKPNRRNRSIKDLKAEYRKGVAIVCYAHYPRNGRDWRELIK